MKDDFLWDGSGEPDAEVERLAQKLGELRYRPVALKLPDRPRPFAARRFSYPVMAMAASLVLMIAAATLWWVRFNPSPEHPARQMAANPGPPPEAVAPQAAMTNQPTDTTVEAAARREPDSRVSPAKRRARKARSVMTEGRPLFTPEEQARGEMARERLMLALRIAGAELREVRKRVEGVAP